MNYWFFLYILMVPAIVLSIRPEARAWIGVGRLMLAILVCYGLMNLAVHLKWRLLNEAVNAMPHPTEGDFRRATSDGANLVFMLVLGWIPAVVYVGWWEVLWRWVYRKRTALMNKWVLRCSTLIVVSSLIITLLTSIFIGRSLGFKAVLHMLLPPFASIFP